MTEQEINIVAEMHRAGRSHAEIQKATGFGYTKVVRAVVIARKAGIVPPRKIKASPRQQVKDRFQNHMIKFGNIGDILQVLSKEQQDWIINEVGKNEYAHVAEYITELVRDAHAESTMTK
jgi:hypothetical protein